jgi:hypothetical protein
MGTSVLEERAFSIFKVEEVEDGDSRFLKSGMYPVDHMASHHRKCIILIPL